MRLVVIVNLSVDFWQDFVKQKSAMERQKNKKNLLGIEIKNKIKELLEIKKSTPGFKITDFSVTLGYSRGFINSTLSNKAKFFNLEHIEKICIALDYPVAKLFEDDVSSQEGQSPQVDPLTPLERALLAMFRELSPQDKGGLLGRAEELKTKEAFLEERKRKEAV